MRLILYRSITYTRIQVCKTTNSHSHHPINRGTQTHSNITCIMHVWVYFVDRFACALYYIKMTTSRRPGPMRWSADLQISHGAGSGVRGRRIFVVAVAVVRINYAVVIIIRHKCMMLYSVNVCATCIETDNSIKMNTSECDDIIIILRRCS